MRNITLVFVVVGLLFSFGCGGPEDKIAKHIGNMQEIMEDNADSPKDGAEALHAYFQDNLPDMMAQVGELITEVDKMDAADRPDRVKEIKETLEPAIKAIAKVGKKFGKAAAKDEDTQKYAMEWMAGYAKLADTLGDLTKLGRLLH